MPRLIVRLHRSGRNVDYLELDDAGAWRRERRAGNREDGEHGRLSTSDAAALFARIEAILTATRRAAGGDPDQVVVLSGFRAHPTAFAAGTPGYAALDAALSEFPWELPPLAPAPFHVSAGWHTSVACGGDARLRMDSSGGVESERDIRGGAGATFHRVRISPEAAAALFADLKARWPAPVLAPRPHPGFRVSARWLTAAFEGDPDPRSFNDPAMIHHLAGGGARRVEESSPDFAPLLERMLAALGDAAPWVGSEATSGKSSPYPRWAPLTHRLTWRRTPPGAAEYETVEGELRLDGRVRQRSGDRALPPIELAPERVDALFGLADRLFDATPGPSEWTPGHDRAPGVHELTAERLEGWQAILRCVHALPAYAALERALLDVLTK